MEIWRGRVFVVVVHGNGTAAAPARHRHAQEIFTDVDFLRSEDIVIRTKRNSHLLTRGVYDYVCTVMNTGII